MKQKVLLELLNSKSPIFNKWLKNSDFSKMILDGVDFSRCDLEGVNFSEASLLRCKFIGANLSKAIFDDAVLDGSDLSWVKDMSYASLSQASMKEIKSSGLNLQHCEANSADFTGSQLQMLCGNYGVFRFSNFSEANLTGAIFRQSNLNMSLFNKCNISKMSLYQSTLIGAEFVGCIADNTLFQGIDEDAYSIDSKTGIITK